MSDHDPAWRSGATVAGWRLERELGRGGMGMVFEASGPDGRRVALKTLLPGAPEEARDRFRREGEAQARVGGHPNIVKILATGEHDDDPYLVTELLTGGDLSSRIKRTGPLEAEAARAIVVAVARGIAHAHAHGVLHRDLKPSNVLFDAEGTPKVADFGLARVEDAQSLTRTGQMLGTAGYMAPEQVDHARQVDARADVYGLGALLFASLTGKAPIPAESLVSSVYALLLEPAPLLRTSFPTAPAALETICARALEKDPARRYPDAASFAAALEAASLAPVPSRRSRALVPVAVVAVGLGAVVAVTLAPGVGRAPPPPPAPPRDAPAVPVAAPTLPPNAPGAGWRLAPGTLRYKLVWNEKSFNAAGLDSEAILTIAVAARAPDTGAHRVEVTWGLTTLASRDEGGFAPKAADQDLARTRAVVAVVADLDPVRGSLAIRRAPTAVVDQVIPPQSPDDQSDLSSAKFMKAWAEGAYQPDPLPRLLALLFARSPLPEIGFEWTRRGGRDVFRSAEVPARVIEPFNWTWAEYGGHVGHVKKIEVTGEREERADVPSRVELHQTVLMHDGKQATDDVVLTRLGPEKR